MKSAAPMGADLRPTLDAALFIAIKRQPILFDIGANAGQTLLEFKRQWPTSLVHCFEPDSMTFARLQSIAREYEGVRANNLALGAEPGMAILHRHRESQMNSLLELGRDGWGNYEAAEAVKVGTVDHYVADQQIDQIDLLKVDAQGYELHVLNGAQEMIRRSAIRLIQVELVFTEMYEGLAKPHDLLRFMDNHGMRFVSLYKVHRTRAGTAEYADALFARI